MSLQDGTSNLIADITRINVLEQEVEYYKTLLQDHDTGHIHTTIGFIRRRIEELEGKFDNAVEDLL